METRCGVRFWLCEGYSHKPGRHKVGETWGDVFSAVPLFDPYPQVRTQASFLWPTNQIMYVCCSMGNLGILGWDRTVRVIFWLLMLHFWAHQDTAKVGMMMYLDLGSCYKLWAKSWLHQSSDLANGLRIMLLLYRIAAATKRKAHPGVHQILWDNPLAVCLQAAGQWVVNGRKWGSWVNIPALKFGRYSQHLGHECEKVHGDGINLLQRRMKAHNLLSSLPRAWVLLGKYTKVVKAPKDCDLCCDYVQLPKTCSRKVLLMAWVITVGPSPSTAQVSCIELETMSCFICISLGYLYGLNKLGYGGYFLVVKAHFGFMFNRLG
ncbi:hypothetical protein Hanom_Chr00s001365g01680911 [Helianthus anomalus]